MVLALTACETQLTGSDANRTCVLAGCSEKDAGIDPCDAPKHAQLRVSVAGNESACGSAIELTRQDEYWVGRVPR
jgi:hypothetical protein